MPNHRNGSFENKKGLSVEVKNNNIETAIRNLGRKVKQEGMIKELRERRFYEQPSTKRRRKAAEAVARHRKEAAERDK